MSRTFGSIFLVYLLLCFGLQVFWSLQFPIYQHCHKVFEFAVVAVAIFTLVLEIGRLFAGTMIHMYTEDGACDLDPSVTLKGWTHATAALLDVAWPALTLYGLALCRAQPSLLFHPRRSVRETLDPAEDLVADPSDGDDDAAAADPSGRRHSSGALEVSPPPPAPVPIDAPLWIAWTVTAALAGVGLAHWVTQLVEGLCSTARDGVYVYAAPRWAWVPALSGAVVAISLAGVGVVLWLSHRWPWLFILQAVAAGALAAGGVSEQLGFYLVLPARLLTVGACVWAHCRVYLTEVETLAAGDSQPVVTALRFASLLSATGADDGTDSDRSVHG